MNNLLVIGGLLVGGYFVLKSMGIDLGGIIPTDSDVVGTSTQTDDSVAALHGWNQTRALMLTAISTFLPDFNGFLSYDQWGYYYSYIRGSAQPPMEATAFAGDRAYLMSIDEWYGYVQPSGLAGIGRNMITDRRTGGPTNYETKHITGIM